MPLTYSPYYGSESGVSENKSSPSAALGFGSIGRLEEENVMQAPSFWPTGGPGRRWNAGSAHSCHSSSAYRCGPETEKSEREKEGEIPPKHEIKHLEKK